MPTSLLFKLSILRNKTYEIQQSTLRYSTVHVGTEMKLTTLLKLTTPLEAMFLYSMLEIRTMCVCTKYTLLN